MDMDNASWAMDQLRAAAEENEKMFTSPSHTVASSAPSGKPNTVPAPTQYVSQFRIDGQPILPPLMTSERRCQMQQLRQRALELEAKYKQANTVRSTTTIDETVILESDSNSSTKSNSSNSSSSSNNTNNSTMNTVHRFPQLQQTKTFIYDSTRQQPQESLSSPRSRPQTLHIEPKNVVNNVIPTICVNPPTPLRGDHQPPKPPPSPSPPKVHYGRMLVTPRRKLNSITNRIIHFERTGKGEQLQLEPQPVNLLWKNKELISVDKRMLRSSTSPSLNAAQLNGMQMQRSRSFTLEEPSQALVEHMRREGNKAPIPPPMPTTAGTSGMTLSSPRCRFAQSATVSSCSSAQSLAHLRRDTVESKAKQVQRSVSSSFEDFGKTTSPGRRCGGHTRSLQNQQQQLKQLLQQALHEADDVLDEQDQQERKQLTLAKRQMFKDIKSAHRDRFQQLVQYQHEEQRRMQAEFDRQQKFLIEQICADINVSAYAPLSSEPSPSGISEYTSTDDLPTPSRLPQNDTIILSPKESSSFTARKRLFDVDTESDAPSELLPIDYATSSPKSITNNISNNNSSNNNNNNNNNNNSSSNNNNVKGKIKKPVQRNYSKTPTARKATSPVLPAKTPPAGRRNINKTTATVAKSNPRNQPQQQSLSKTRRSASPSRQSLPAMELDEIQRRHEAATLLSAATRGFLVRRLFRTEQVQRIVQTIRDTLIFVLNLHLETYGTSLDQEEPANIRLKARLLQQLCSASRTLHLIFFQTSIKERMEIIARDRKRIKIKSIAGHAKQRQ